mmetsp:Transcript_5099/g.14183  ORF Transcript_5099/g.14183 Transcript_5099/m.14183 type:complete len:255 (-) Transcript_5099:477-1241(-)
MCQPSSSVKLYCPDLHGSKPLQPPPPSLPPPAEMKGSRLPNFCLQKSVPFSRPNCPKLPFQADTELQEQYPPTLAGLGVGDSVTGAGAGVGTETLGSGCGDGCGLGSGEDGSICSHWECQTLWKSQSQPASQHVGPVHPSPPHRFQAPAHAPGGVGTGTGAGVGTGADVGTDDPEGVGARGVGCVVGCETTAGSSSDATRASMHERKTSSVFLTTQNHRNVIMPVGTSFGNVTVWGKIFPLLQCSVQPGLGPPQ